MLVLRERIRVSERVKVREWSYVLSFASSGTLSLIIRLADSCQGVRVAFRFRDYGYCLK